MKKFLMAVAAAAATGAAVMYLLDSASGRRRRARLRDGARHVTNVVGTEYERTTRDMSNRAQGLRARIRSRLAPSLPVSDDVLTERIRSKVGRLVSHPRAIEVKVAGGHVTLAGPILIREVRSLLDGVAAVPGVTGLDDHLEQHESPEHVAALQNGRPAPVAARVGA
jgi:osmotically-inducible protein OsmY